MMKHIILALLITLSSPVAAQDYDKGVTALYTGPVDFATALKELKPLAEDGDPFSQWHLGFMYLKGLGVLSDYVLSHMWYNIASVNGHKLGTMATESVAEKMTPAAIEKAQAMARECMSSGYTKCGY